MEAVGGCIPNRPNATPKAAVTMLVSKRRLSAARWLRSAKYAAVGTTGLVLLSLACFRLHLNLSAVSFTYLLLLLGQSLTGDFISAAIVSVLAVGFLDYFFAQPLFSLQVSAPTDMLALITFLVTAMVVTKLVTRVRNAARAADIQHRKLTRLYELAQELLALEPELTVGADLLKPFLGVFGVRAAALYDAVSDDMYLAGDSREYLAQETHEAFVRGQDKDEGSTVIVRCIRSAGKTTAAIGFEGLQDTDLTIGPLSALAAALLDRMHAFRSANRAAAAAQTEQYRSVILDALAHEFKTPLATILAAAGALQEAGSLGPEHIEMAETVENEAARLGRLTTRLIRTARLEREEIKPWMELIDVSSVVSDTVDQYARITSNRRFSVNKEPNASEVLADPELLRLALSQLLDNACKYSEPETPIVLDIEREDSDIAIRVASHGTPIPAAERNHIFDRFYRGAEARRVAGGTGLGLYVARKIALAHGGSLDLDLERSSEGTTFRLSIPVGESERNGAGANN